MSDCLSCVGYPLLLVFVACCMLSVFCDCCWYCLNVVDEIDDDFVQETEIRRDEVGNHHLDQECDEVLFDTVPVLGHLPGGR